MARPTGPDGRKSAVLTLRITPKVRYGLELMARVHRETIPEVVARAISEIFAAEEGGLFVFTDDDGEHPKNLLNLVWAERPSDQLINLALRYPSVMSRAETATWHRILETPKYWRTERARRSATPPESALLRELVAQDWGVLSQSA